MGNNSKDRLLQYAGNIYTKQKANYILKSFRKKLVLTMVSGS